MPNVFRHNISLNKYNIAPLYNAYILMAQIKIIISEIVKRVLQLTISKLHYILRTYYEPIFIYKKHLHF